MSNSLSTTTAEGVDISFAEAESSFGDEHAKAAVKKKKNNEVSHVNYLLGLVPQRQ